MNAPTSANNVSHDNCALDGGGKGVFDACREEKPTQARVARHAFSLLCFAGAPRQKSFTSF